MHTQTRQQQTVHRTHTYIHYTQRLSCIDDKNGFGTVVKNKAPLCKQARNLINEWLYQL